MVIKDKIYCAIGACLLFIFGFSVCLLGKQTEVTPHNNTPIRLYDQYKKVVVDQTCPIKGKASSSKKIYHLAGNQWYSKLKQTDCFASEEEAKAAGFRKSSR